MPIPAVKPAISPLGKQRRGHRQAMKTDMLSYLEHLAQQGNFLKVSDGVSPLYFVNDPDIAEQILLREANAFNKPFPVKFVAKGLFGDNLFTSDGSLWKVLRSTLQPIFSKARLNHYADIASQLTQEMLDTWTMGQMIQIPDVMMDLTLGITTLTFFGVDLRQESDGAGIIRFIELFSESISSLPIPLWIPTRRNREMKDLVRHGNKLYMRLINERRPNADQYEDVLSILVQAQKTDQTGLLSDRQICNEVSNLFAAGYELVGLTLTYTLYFLSQHPDVENHLRDQIQQQIGDRPPTFEDLENLPYLEQVIQESMRLIPAVAIFARQSNQNLVLGDNPIAKNSLMLISNWTLHRRPDIYPNPQQFNPDRFSPEHRDKIPRYAYSPFSNGPRVCIGRAFAMMQMRINLAMILQRFRLEVPHDYRLELFFRFNVRPKYGLPMHVRPLKSEEH